MPPRSNPVASEPNRSRLVGSRPILAPTRIKMSATQISWKPPSSHLWNIGLEIERWIGYRSALAVNLSLSGSQLIDVVADLKKQATKTESRPRENYEPVMHRCGKTLLENNIGMHPFVVAYDRQQHERS